MGFVKSERASEDCIGLVVFDQTFSGIAVREKVDFGLGLSVPNRPFPSLAKSAICKWIRGRSPNITVGRDAVRKVDPRTSPMIVRKIESIFNNIIFVQQSLARLDPMMIAFLHG
jgi:hypothetical protein